jgi:phosphotransferase system  glucose/maltose/N-acetylglucosamine-specific IIC component
MPARLRSVAAAVLFFSIGAVVAANPQHAGVAVIIVMVVYLLVERLVVRRWRVRHQRHLTG